MLFANVCSTTSFILFYALVAVVRTGENFWLTGFLWDLTDVSDSILRIWIIAHSADLLRSIVTILLCTTTLEIQAQCFCITQGVKSVPVLRKLRDGYSITTQRKKVINCVCQFHANLRFFSTTDDTDYHRAGKAEAKQRQDCWTFARDSSHWEKEHFTGITFLEFYYIIFYKGSFTQRRQCKRSSRTASSSTKLSEAKHNFPLSTLSIFQ